MTLLCILQSDFYVPQVGRAVHFVKHRMFDKDIIKEILKEKTVELISFCLMPNHFHLILRGNTKDAISKFMQRLGNAYTKYFNAHHKRNGHLFGSGFQSIHIDTNEYLSYLSAYVHLNPRELKQWRGKEVLYPWSSFQDLVKEDRWSEFLNHSVITEQFDNPKEYFNFVEESDIKNNLNENYLIDYEF